MQDGHDILYLSTNKFVIYRNIIPLPITESVIYQVHNIAKIDNMPKGLKIVSKTDLTLFGSL